MKRKKKFFVIVQSIKNTDTAKEKGYDEKISGIKWHIAVNVLLHAVSLTKANIQDRKGASDMFCLYHNNLYNVQNVLAGY